MSITLNDLINSRQGNTTGENTADSIMAKINKQVIKYDFKVGDKVITTTGETGVITDICTCSACFSRGFYEPMWTSNEDGEYHYITLYDAETGFTDYYKIGEYRFNDFDEKAVLDEMHYLQRKIGRLCDQLYTIVKIRDEEK